MNIADYHREIQAELEETHYSCLEVLKKVLGTIPEPAPITYRTLLVRGSFSINPPHIYIGKPNADELQIYLDESRYADWRASVQFTCAHETGHYVHASSNSSFYSKLSHKKREFAEKIAEITAFCFLHAKGNVESYVSRAHQEGSTCYYDQATLKLYRASSNPAALLRDLTRREYDS